MEQAGSAMGGSTVSPTPAPVQCEKGAMGGRGHEFASSMGSSALWAWKGERASKTEGLELEG